MEKPVYGDDVVVSTNTPTRTLFDTAAASARRCAAHGARRQCVRRRYVLSPLIDCQLALQRSALYRQRRHATYHLSLSAVHRLRLSRATRQTLHTRRF